MTEHAQTVAPIDDGPTTKTITLKELLERISHGYIPDEYLKRLAVARPKRQRRRGGQFWHNRKVSRGYR